MPGHLFRDILYGLRSMRRSPGFTAVAVLTLALGIGANTAVFSVVNAVLLRPLPYQDPSRLVWLHDGMTPHDAEGWPACMTDFLLWRERTRSFSQLAAFSYDEFALTGEGDAENLPGALVSAQFFEVLGVRPIRGHTFAPDADQPGQAPVALISERLWRRKFAAAEVVGRVVTLDGRPTTIVGIVPATFTFVAPNADIWPILTLNPTNRRGPFFLRGVARLAPGVTLAQAASELDGLGQEVERADPLKLEHARYPVVPLQQQIVGDVRPLLLVLAGTVSLVLLIAVFNVANLMLARATARRREIAVRLSIGASYGRLVRQLLTESLTLALAGGIAGAALAYAGVWVLRSAAPPGLPRLGEIAVDWRCLLVTFLLSIGSGVLFGLAPALISTKGSLGDTLKEGGRSGTEGGGTSRVRGALVVAEMALSLVLLAGAGLLIRSFVLLGGVPTGFLAPPDHLLSMEISPNSQKYRDDAVLNNYWQNVLDGVQTAPGVEDAALTITMPPDRTAFTDGFEIPGKTPPDGGPIVPVPFISTGYFRTLGIPLLRGRYFDANDRIGSPPVAIISETMARRYFPGENPIGRRLKHGGPHQNNPFREIVGVVGDVKYSGLNQPNEPVYYEPAAQSASRPMWLIARTRDATSEVGSQINARIHSVDPGVPVSQVGPMSRVLFDSIELPRFRAWLMAAFALAALLLACVGLYGVIAYYVTQRTHEIGVRMALGATSLSVLGLVAGRALRLASGGISVGMIGALALVPFVRSMLFGIGPFDALTLGGVALLLTLVAMLAAWLPANRAARVDPMKALRDE
jgi:predicted permease